VRDELTTAFRGLFKSGVIVFAGFVIEMTISFFAKILAARWLSQAEYGSVAIGSSLLSVLVVFVLLGTHDGVSRYLPRCDDDVGRRGVIVSAFQIVLPVAVAVMCATYLLADPIAVHIFDDSRLGPVLQIFAITLPFMALTKLALGATQGMEQTTPKVLLENVGTPIVRLVLVVVAVVLGAEVIGIAWAYAVARIVPALAGLYFLYRLTPLFSGWNYSPMRRELVTFSAPLTISAAMGRILADIDTYLLGYYTNLGLVGTYNVIYPIAGATGFLLSAFGYMTTPMISRLHGKGQYQEMSIIYKGISKWVFLTTLPLFIIIFLFPQSIISTTFGNKYVTGGTALQLLILSFVATSLTGPSVQVLTSVGDTWILMIFNVIAAAVNLSLNIVLIPQYELFGAAAATVVSSTLLELLVVTRLYRQTGLHPFSRALVLPATFGIVLVTGLYTFISSIFGVSLASAASLCLVFLPLYAVGILRLGGIEQQEIMILESIEDRFNADLDPVKRLARWFM
jgi:O-antigen/teichoic acid export membrane protein